MQESLQVLDNIRLNFPNEGLFVLNLSLAFIMFGVALEIKPDNLKKIFLSPKPAIIGIVSRFVILPAVTFGLVLLSRNLITPTIALGMILVAACPGGNISNFISALAKANRELSISLTAFAPIAAIVLSPLNFTLYSSLFVRFYNTYDASEPVRPLEIDPYNMFQTVFILLGIPIVLGMLFGWKFPKITSKITNPIKILSILIFFGMVVMMFSKNYEYFIKYIKYIFIIVFIHKGLGLLAGFSLSSFFRPSGADVRNITIEKDIQNSGLSLAGYWSKRECKRH